VMEDDDAKSESPEHLEVIDQSAFTRRSGWCTHLPAAASKKQPV
jgi:hypothetical protein